METPRILAVDDDPHIRAALKSMLQTLGYDVETADGGAAAVALVREQPFDVAIVDYVMPDMNGVEVFEAVRMIQPDLVGVFLTAHARLDVVYFAVSAGATRVLAKPLDIVEIGELLEGIVDDLATREEQGEPEVQRLESLAGDELLHSSCEFPEIA